MMGALITIFRKLILGITPVLVAGCQVTAMDLEDARQVAVEFQPAAFQSPPRTISDIRSMIGDLQIVPANCKEHREIRQEELEFSMEELRNARNGADRQMAAYFLFYQVDFEIIAGQFDRAIEIIESAPRSLPEGLRRERRWMYHKLVEAQTKLGNRREASRAASHLRGVDSGIRRDTAGGWAQRQKIARASDARLANVKGDFSAAERLYRTALSSVLWEHDVVTLRADLARLLVRQGRFVEAEAVSREAIEVAVKWSMQDNLVIPQANLFNPYTGELLAVMAEAVVAQGRVDEADYLARTAINMFEVACADPQALGLIEARRSLISVLAVNQDWTGIIAEIEAARIDLASFKDLFDRIFGSNMNYVEALINTGAADRAVQILSTSAQTQSGDLQTTNVTQAELGGIMALALLEQGKGEQALELFKEIIPGLSGSSLENVNLARRERILGAYMHFLLSEQGQIAASTIELDIPNELLGIATTAHDGQVRKAISATSARMVVSNEDLASLIRQHQDATEGLKLLQQTLAYLSTSASNSISQLNDIRARVQAFRLALTALDDELGSRFPEYSSLINPQPLTESQIRSYLKAHQAIVVYHVLNNQTIVWAISPNGSMKWSQIDVSHSELSKMVSDLRKAVDPGSISTLDDIPELDTKLTHSLYQLLLMPVISELANATEVYIVADGPLGTLPFSMLTLSPDDLPRDRGLLFDRYRDVQWFAREKAITYLPAVISLQSIHRSRGAMSTDRQPFIGFGDPYFNQTQASNAAIEKNVQLAALPATRGFSIKLRSVPQTRSVDSAELGLLPRLPATDQELRSIATSLGADPEISVFTGKRANEMQIKGMKLDAVEVLMFATHGLIPGDLNGLDQPALALTAPEIANVEGDGLLTLGEILGLKLNADWVVLSACNTAAGDGEGAEAISGLGRAFFYAGARSLLVSNWPVHSNATAELTKTLFGLQAKDESMGRSRALQQTRLHMIDEAAETGSDGKPVFSYAHPIFWAPFTLIGDGGS